MVGLGESPLPSWNIKSTVRSSGSFICGFAKPEQAFPLKEEQPSRRGEMGVFQPQKKCSQFSHQVCCALKPFFVL